MIEVWFIDFASKCGLEMGDCACVPAFCAKAVKSSLAQCATCGSNSTTGTFASLIEAGAPADMETLVAGVCGGTVGVHCGNAKAATARATELGPVISFFRGVAGGAAIFPGSPDADLSVFTEVAVEISIFAKSGFSASVLVGSAFSAGKF